LSIKELADIIIDIRKQKLPDYNSIGTAWSFFQNPIVSKQHYEDLKQAYPNLVWFEVDEDNIKLSAGQLIELCGFKWYREWDAGVFSNHALVLVNYANAKWEDLINLAKNIQSKVYATFNVKIFPEVNYI
jgi:UDP-N-acetylmuramate dehydrogenase